MEDLQIPPQSLTNALAGAVVVQRSGELGRVIMAKSGSVAYQMNLFPIPQSEIDKTPLVVQNPSW